MWRPQRAFLARLRSPFDAATAAATLVIVAPALAMVGRATGAPAFAAATPLLGLALLLALLRRPEARQVIQLNLLTAAVVAYTLVNATAALTTLHAAAPLALIAQLATGLASGIAPVTFYFVGVALCIPPPHVSQCTAPTPVMRATAPSVTVPQDDHIASVTRQLACALLGVALPLAGWAVARAFGVAGAFGAPTSVGLPDPATLANLLAIAGVVASASDAPNATLRLALGETPDTAHTHPRRRALFASARRIALALCIPLGAFALVAGMALTWSRIALLATGAALVVVSVARRRYGRLVAFALLAPVVLALVSRGFTGWLSPSFVAFEANLSPAQAPAFMATLAALTLLGLALARLWVTYARLRPTSGAAGLTLAALGVTVYLLGASITSAPLSEPAVGVSCWLLLGMASGVADALEHGASAMQSATRGYPLRVLFVVDGAANAETQAAVNENIRAFDRRRVIPHLIVLPLIVAPTAVAWREPTGWRVIPATLRWRRGTLSRWADLLRSMLDARPDLIVAASPGAYLPATIAGRLIGAPVQWHAREIADPRRQPILDAFAHWTAGIVACSQYVARSFQIEALGSRLRVVRLGVTTPTPLTAKQRRELREALCFSLGVFNADPLIIYPGPIATGSSHADLIQAMQLLRVRYPQAHLLFASEASAGVGDHTQIGGSYQPYQPAQAPADLCALVCDDPRAEQRLACAISLNRLDGAIHSLGPRADLAAVIAVCDLAVFPQWASPLSRGAALALAQGVPIVSVQSGALAEQLADAWGRLLTGPHDAAALAATLTQAIGRLDALRQDARHNRTLARDWQSATVEAARLQTLYRQICLPGARTPTQTTSVGAPPSDAPSAPAPEARPLVPFTARSRAWAETLWSVSQE